MHTFQLDQNLNDRRFAADCERSQLANVWLFPKILRDKPDEEILPIFMASDRPLVTMDREIATAHPHAIPDRNPGIVVVGFALGHVKTLTTKDARMILSTFKKLFQDWSTRRIGGSVLEITNLGVEVSHVFNHRFVRDSYLSYAEPGWCEKLVRILDANLARSTSRHRDLE